MFCRQPASAAPRLSASTAWPDSDPKLIAEMLTTDSGRKAPRRSRAAPSTLAQGSSTLVRGLRRRGPSAFAPTSSGIQIGNVPLAPATLCGNPMSG